MKALFLLFAMGAVMLPAAEVAKSVNPKNVVSSQFESKALGEMRHYNVLLPADYESSTSRYPVLYLLHGYGDDHTAWTYMTNLSQYASRQRLIIVMPDGSKSFYINSASDPKARFEDYLMKDLIPFIDANYRTIPLPRSRAVAGLSMGGYGAALLGLKHPRTFAAIGTFSGAVGIAHDAPTMPAEAEARRRTEQMQAMFGPVGSAERASRDPIALLDKVAMADMPMLYIACGGEDFLIEQNRAFVKRLAEKKIPYEYREISPQGHSWDFWDDHVKVFLDLLTRLDGFR